MSHGQAERQGRDTTETLEQQQSSSRGVDLNRKKGTGRKSGLGRPVRCTTSNSTESFERNTISQTGVENAPDPTLCISSRDAHVPNRLRLTYP